MGRTRPTVAPVRLSRSSTRSDLPAARGEALRDQRAREARADDDRAAANAMGRRALALAMAGEHLALVAEALALVDAEPGAGQRGAHAARHRPGGERGPGDGHPRELAHHLGGPHLGIPRGGESVQEERVRACLQLRQQLARVARHQRELHAPAVELQAVEARDRGRPDRDESRGEGAQLLERREGLGEVLRGEGMALDRDEMQPRGSLRVGAERVPRGEEVEPEAEAGLEDGERVTPAPAPRQAVPREEDVAGLGEPAGCGVVRVLEPGREGHAQGGALELRGGDADGSAGHGGMIPPRSVLPARAARR